jgi:hypothetical protein
MDRIWIASLASRDFQQHRSWPVAAYRSEAAARAAVPALEAWISEIRAAAQARAAFLAAWETDHPRPPDSLLPAPGNPYLGLRRHQVPETMTAHARAADAAWLAARQAALAEAGLAPRTDVPEPLLLAERLLDARIEISSLPLHS